MEEKEQTTPSNTIFENTDRLMQLYCNYESNAKFVVDKMWANVKFFTTITSALLTTSVALYGSKSIQNTINIDPNIKSLVFAVIPIIVIMISVIGMKNLKREYKRFLEWIVVIQKIHDMLGLHEEVQAKIYPGDKSLFPEHFENRNYNTSEQFVEDRLKKKGSLFHYFNMLHRAYVIIALIITALILAGPFKLCVKELVNICS